ncbi:inactive pancreatic lipase-related protein 1-like [Megalops cyprinoides]|uniref:inactive pancreatic lipase-related protein 1-like n=1 Tax=Megalops cyprinoides TaxID=118141 RepID=UPI0018655CA3|nr:inactive pancreatic lipase-related protein 1-like [Megalops cyprinoides]
MHWVWILGLVLLGSASGAEVCYENLGCFSDDIPWAGTVERPIAQLPWSPEKIGARFLLYTRQNPNNHQEISTNKDILLASNYQGNRKTRYIIHGYIDKGDENWLIDMCKLMLQVEDINCICVDWKKGGRTLYTQSANNIRVVGAQIAYMIQLFMENYKQRPDAFHVIGHSLGAHCAGEVGRRIPNLGRITGLDPAEPYFQGCPALVRLDPGDAKFVDVIHTDSLPIIPYVGMGMSQAVGHLDFYPNGGEHMPGCDKNIISQIVDIDGIWEGTRDFVACNHLRSYKYYSDSILNPEGFTGYPCSDGGVFESGRCFPCGDGACPFMGHHADKFRRPSGAEKMKFYLNTGNAKPFGRYRYKVVVTITGDRALVLTGAMSVAIYGTDGNTRQYQVHKGILRPGNTYEVYVDTENDVGELTMMKFIWNNSVINPMFPKLGAKRIEVQRGKDRRAFSFCGSETVREEVLQSVPLCTVV